jgi:hydrogenase/urease accessory protein HupE
MTIAAPLVAQLSQGHRMLLHARGPAGPADDVLYATHDRLTLDVASSAPSPSPSRGVAAFVAMGVEHILTGYDHLLFLVGLVLVGGRLKSLLGVVTAFTVAHSVTLALAVLGVWTPSARLVEPAIALSIAYVGVENFALRDGFVMSKRWRLALPFGLVHGFGFSAALREIALPRVDVPAALFGFNAGVELGQLAVLAVVLPALHWLRKQPWFERRGVRALSGAIATMGLAWFVARVAA